LPIILTSRADSLRVRLASAALAKLLAERTAKSDLGDAAIHIE
jgi:phosphate acetyltransferase